MSSDLLPAADAASAFAVSDSKINRTAALLGGFVIFGIYPAYELLRLWWGVNESPFSSGTTITAIVCGVLFGFNVRRRVRALAEADGSDSDEAAALSTRSPAAASAAKGDSR